MFCQQVSIDVQIEVSIGDSPQLSVDGLEVSVNIFWEVSVDELMLTSVDADLFSLQIVRSKSVGSENNSYLSLLLLVLLGMHLK